ncbi:MAG TPA: alkaline phosphatase D family protein [Longimicrobiales bacterium]|nr:alkaline phosphatase D family protein [Longimicrobiales bacterium]
MSPRPPRWFDLFDASPAGSAAGWSRRRFLRVGRDVAALLAAGALPAWRSDPRPPFRQNPFTFGVASGDPGPGGVVLWTRLDPGAVRDAGAVGRDVAVRWEVAEDDGFRTVVRSGESRALPELGHSVHAEVDGLEPGRPYWYRFHTGGVGSVAGRTRTAPARGASPERLRFAFASCQNFDHGYFTAYRHMAEEDPDLIVHLGDYIYESRWGEIVRDTGLEEPYTLDDYRDRYALYRREEPLQTAHAACPWVVTWDDHEVDNNYADDVPEDAQGRDAFLLRRAAAYQAFYEFMPLRRSSIPTGPNMQLFRRLDFGDLARFHVLDTRQYRADQACGDGWRPRCWQAEVGERSLLGPEQEVWLEDGLWRSPARWNVLAQQVRMAQATMPDPEGGDPSYALDMWDGYPRARQRLLDALAEERPANPVVLTGDIHSHWAADLKRDFRDPRSETVGVELVGSSITSGGDGAEAWESSPRILDANPHIRFFNARRGYVRVTLDRRRCTSEFRVVPWVSRPGAPLETRARFVVEDGRPGLAEA